MLRRSNSSATKLSGSLSSATKQYAPYGRPPT